MGYHSMGSFQIINSASAQDLALQTSWPPFIMNGSRPWMLVDFFFVYDEKFRKDEYMEKMNCETFQHMTCLESTSKSAKMNKMDMWYTFKWKQASQENGNNIIQRSWQITRASLEYAIWIQTVLLANGNELHHRRPLCGAIYPPRPRRECTARAPT